MNARRVLVVGVGSIGERHVRCFQSTGRAEVAICEPLDARRCEIAGRYGVTRAGGDFARSLTDELDAVVICTPAQLHVEMAIQCVTAGLPVLIEKPLSTSLEGVDRLRRLAADRSVPVAVAYTWRSLETLNRLREQVRGGEYGRPLLITVTSGQHFPTYRPAYRDIYYRDRRTGGGAIQDALTHLFNACEWVAGPITEICVDAAHLALEGVAVEDTVAALARHGPVLAAYTLNQFQAPNETTITLVCERGTLRLENHRNRLRSMTEPGGSWQDQDFGATDRDTPYRRQATAFLNLLDGNATCLCTLDEAVQSLRTNLAALRSAETRSWQRIDESGKP